METPVKSPVAAASKSRDRRVRDVLYEYIVLSDLAKQIVDTPVFQRLRMLRQLGVTHHVFPSANHTRFEHSLGVYHLTGKFLHYLNKTLCEKDKLTKRVRELIKIAGLCHDIGHTVFSHLFDNYLARPLQVPHHEERSASLIDYLVTRCLVSMTSGETTLVKALVQGMPIPGYPAWIFEIVANSRFQLDVDKLDYLVRDSYYTGSTSNLQINRIFSFARIINDHICFHEKVYMQVFDVFVTRYRLHREVYRHPVVVSVELMMVDLLTRLSTIEDWATKFKSTDPRAWMWITDSYIDALPTTCQDLKIITLLSRLQNRNLYKQIKEDSKTTAANSEKEQREPSIPVKTETGKQKDDEKADSTDRITVTSVIGFSSNAKRNPMAEILFYNDVSKEPFPLSPHDVSLLLPENSSETKELVFSRESRD